MSRLMTSNEIAASFKFNIFYFQLYQITVYYFVLTIDSMSGGWLNPPVRFEDEPCRHKILDLIGDFSLLAQNGNQGFPIAHIVAYKVCSLNSTMCLLYTSIASQQLPFKTQAPLPLIGQPPHKFQAHAAPYTSLNECFLSLISYILQLSSVIWILDCISSPVITSEIAFLLIFGFDLLIFFIIRS